MFDTHDALHQALTRTGIWNGLFTALMTSTPPLAVRSHCTDDDACGLAFFEQRPKIHNAPVTGSVTIEPKSGAILVRADGYTGPRWHAALDRLVPQPETAWSWQPDADYKPGRIDGILHLAPSITAETTLERSSRHEGNAHAGLVLFPATREACETAWILAVVVLGALVTHEPEYRSPVLTDPAADKVA
ncbi:hypothetical protein [Streptomyces sp. SCL15-6]|uniref:hypothetical protein n=1 Tax=Streptomyces sp. SCL15-6 TaxID=2967222 RepID=UPI002966345C|nr:hypothetical protein [Streptomyces sp. SCL15-6]